MPSKYFQTIAVVFVFAVALLVNTNSIWTLHYNSYTSSLSKSQRNERRWGKKYTHRCL